MNNWKKCGEEGPECGYGDPSSYPVLVRFGEGAIYKVPIVAFIDYELGYWMSCETYKKLEPQPNEWIEIPEWM